MNFPRIFLFAIALLFSAASQSQTAPAEESLSDIYAERVFYHSQGWGEPGINTSVVPPDGRAPMKLDLNGTEYEKGLGFHAPSETILDLNGDFALFRADIGIQKQANTEGSVIFQVFLDQQKVYESQVLRPNQAPVSVSIPVEGAAVMRMAFLDAGDGITCDCANLCNPILARSAHSKSGKPGRAAFDIAPFAQAVTFDPSKMDGARSSRVQEFDPKEVFLSSPIPRADGLLIVPKWQGTTGCIGLEWLERRLLREVSIQFAKAPSAALAEKSHVEIWSGESPWQGKWLPLKGAIEVSERAWAFKVSGKENPELPVKGTEKIRWIIPDVEDAVRVSALTAISRGAWAVADITLQADNGFDEENAQIEMYNGELIDAASKTALTSSWDLANPLHLKVRYAIPMPWKTDRTTLRIKTPRGGFAIAVDDVLKEDSVYSPDYAIAAVKGDKPIELAELKKKLDAGDRMLEVVRRSPDVTFASAIQHVHNPIQDHGPMMVSLACDNWKFASHRDGTLEFNLSPNTPDQWSQGWYGEIKAGVVFDEGKAALQKRYLDGGWQPIPTLSYISSNGLLVTQKTFTAPYGDPVEGSPWLYTKPLCISRMIIENPGASVADCALAITFQQKDSQPFALSASPNGVIVKFKDRPIAFIQAPPQTNLSLQGNQAVYRGALAAGAHLELALLVPGWEAKTDETLAIESTQALEDATRAYWEKVLAKSTQITVPDGLLNNVYRASQVHCFLAARHDPKTGFVAPWISSDRYGPLESEAHSIVLGMDRLGQEEFTTSSLDYFISQYNQQGFLTTGYTLMGTGWHLWTLAEHFALTQGSEWLKKNAPEIARVCNWVVKQTEKSKRKGFDKEECPESGLFPPGVGADWNRFAYRFCLQGHFYFGLNQAAEALKAIGEKGSQSLLAAASEYKSDILKAYEWNQARSPLVRMMDGSWVPPSPSILYCLGPTGDIFPGEDGNRTWCYDVELGAHHLIPLGLLDPEGRETDWSINYLEDDFFLQEGMADYPAAKSKADPFNLGGFSKVQPYYTRIVDVYALRDEVKPFIRSYFNAIPSLLSLENLSFWEHFRNLGGWNKTHETGWFLAQTGLMFTMNRGDDLWLAPFVPNYWMADGKKVSVKDAPTHFGPVSYELASSSGKGYIEASIDCPTRKAPHDICLRLRHPAEKKIKRVEVDGIEHKRFDADKEVIRLTSTGKTIHVKAFYD